MTGRSRWSDTWEAVGRTETAKYIIKVIDYLNYYLRFLFILTLPLAVCFVTSFKTVLPVTGLVLLVGGLATLTDLIVRLFSIAVFGVVCGSLLWIEVLLL